MPLLPLVLIGLLPLGEPRFEQLDNGLRVVILEDHTLPLVSVQLWYRVGSAQDPPSKPGLCSVARSILEYRDDAALKLRAAGLRFESRTLRDACYFSSVLPPNFLEYVLDIEAARMGPLTVSAEMVERGLNTAACQYAEVADDPNHVLMRHALAAMFPDHPYEHPPGFVAASLKDLSTDEAKEFLRRWFVVGNATLFVIGDVSTVRVLDQVRQRFDKLEWAEPPRRAEPARLPAETIRISVPHPDRAGVTIVWRTPPLGYFENAAIDVLMRHLCNGVDGVLAQELTKRGFRYEPTWRRYAWRDRGVLLLNVDLWRGQPERDPAPSPDFSTSTCPKTILDLFEGKLRASATRIPSEIEHNRARALAERDVCARQAAFPDRAHTLAEHEVIGGDLLLAEFSVPRIRAVAVPDVQVAGDLLNSTRCVIVKYCPGDSDPISSDPPRLEAALDGSPAPPIDAGATLKLMREHASTAPVPAAPVCVPAISSRRLGKWVTLKTCVVAATGPAAMLSVKSTQEVPRGRLFSDYDRREYPRRQEYGSEWSREAADYMSYHGITLDRVENSASAGYLSRVRSECVPACIEWHERLMRTWKKHFDAGPPFRDYQEVSVLAVGSVSAAELEDSVRECWAAWTGPPKTAPPEDACEDGEPGPEPENSNEQRTILCMWWIKEKRPDVQLKLWIELPLLDGKKPLDELEFDAFAFLIACAGADDPSLGGQHVLWRRASVLQGGSDDIQAVVSVRAEHFEKIVRYLWARIKSIQDGSIRRADLETAMRLARMKRLLSLDSNTAILSALWRHEGNPWDLRPDLTGETLLSDLSESRCSLALWIEVYSSDPAMENAARALRHELSPPLKTPSEP